MATLAYCGNFMNGYDGNGNGIFVKVTDGETYIDYGLFPHITLENGDENIVVPHIRSLRLGGINSTNDTDSDIFIITGNNLKVYQSPCTPRMFCLYGKSSSSSTTLVAKNHDIQMKEIYSSTTASAASLTIANDYQKLVDHDGDYNNVSRMFNVIDSNVLNKITTQSQFKVSFTYRPTYSPTNSKPGSMQYQIGGSVFYGCADLVKCKIPGFIHRIASNAFSNCSSLSSVTYQNSDFMWRFEIGAFSDCTSLSSITIPKYCSIDGSSGVFSGCTSLSRVVFEGYNYKSPLKIISSACTSQCEDIKCFMTFIGLGSDGNYNRVIKKIPAGCFNGCTMLLGSATPIASGTTYKDNDYILWKSFHIPFGVDEIGDYAFSGCTNLCREKLEVDNRQNGGVFLNGVKQIGNSAFTGCQHIRYLVGLNYGINDDNGKLYCVNKIGDYAFSGCTNLQYLYDKGYNNNCVAENELLNAKNIGIGAFSDCTNLSSITISNDTTIGTSAFSGCTNLKNIYVKVTGDTCISDNNVLGQLDAIFDTNVAKTFHIGGDDGDYDACIYALQTKYSNDNFVPWKVRN
jgi:hypothetical protein